MKKSVLGLSAAAVLLVSGAAFANDQDTRVAAVDKSAAAFQKLDSDTDGRVSAIEAANDTKVATGFTQADVDGDGYLSKSEFKSMSRVEKDTERHDSMNHPAPQP